MGAARNHQPPAWSPAGDVSYTSTAPTSPTKHAASRLCTPVPASDALSATWGCTTATRHRVDSRRTISARLGRQFPQGPHKLRKVDRATGRAVDLRRWPDTTVPDRLLAVTNSSVVLLTWLGLADDESTARAVQLTTVPLNGGPSDSMTITPPSGSRINDFDLHVTG